MKARIEPDFKAQGEVVIPASKSLSHRALIAAGLADGTSRITNLVDNEDTRATINCLKKLGATFEENGNELIVHGIHDFKHYDESVVDCNESGSTLRFLIPIFSLTNKRVTFTGHGKLMLRPQTVYEKIFKNNHLGFTQKDGTLKIKGALKSGIYNVQGNISSQFITGLLFTLPMLDGDSAIAITPPYESKSYVGLTEDVLELAGIKFHDTGTLITIPGNQKYQPIEMRVEGDDSQAAFFGALALITGQDIHIQNIRHDSRQGDHAFLSILEAMGGTCEETEGGYSIHGGNLKGTEIDLEDCPDLGPVLFALASQCEGKTVFRHCDRLRIKESDRIACMEEELRKLGCTIWSENGTVTVEGKSTVEGNVTLNGHNDHRIVMALTVLSSIAAGPVTIMGAEAINKSYPDFFKDYQKVGGKVEVSL